MLQAILIGNLGADAEVKSSNGNEFITFRVAHNERWTDANGTQHDQTNWVDCTMNGKPKVFEFLKAGTTVFVTGQLSTRIYSSAKDRCMKAGVQIACRHLELLGGKADPVPRQLIDENGGLHDVTKYYHTDVSGAILMTAQGRQYAVDDNGWVLPLEQAKAMADAQVEQETKTKDNGESKA